MKKNISILTLVIFLILLVLSLGYCIKKINNSKQYINTLEQRNNELSGTIVNLETDMSNKDKEEAKVSIPVFDNSKIENIQEGMDALERMYETSSGITVSVIDNSLAINLYAEAAGNAFGYTGDDLYHVVTGFNKKIIDIKVIHAGPGEESLKIIMLMEDGVIKYIPISNILDNSFTVLTVKNAENIIRLVKVDVSIEKTNRYIDIVGIRPDGTAILLEW